MKNFRHRLLVILLGIGALAIGLLFFTWRLMSDFADIPKPEAYPDQDQIHLAYQEAREIYPPIADGFDFPIGPPDAKKYYNAQGFQKNNHLGEDWNGLGGGNTDKGDPVYATGHGIVTSAQDEGAGWGQVIIILHNMGSDLKPRRIESLYGHLDRMIVEEGDTVRRGQQIGTIGDANGAYWAHLHFEMRHQIDMGVLGGYSTDTTGFLVPTAFIKSHRKIQHLNDGE